MFLFGAAFPCKVIAFQCHQKTRLVESFITKKKKIILLNKSDLLWLFDPLSYDYKLFSKS